MNTKSFCIQHPFPFPFPTSIHKYLVPIFFLKSLSVNFKFLYFFFYFFLTKLVREQAVPKNHPHFLKKENREKQKTKIKKNTWFTGTCKTCTISNFLRLPQGSKDRSNWHIVVNPQNTTLLNFQDGIREKGPKQLIAYH